MKTYVYNVAYTQQSTYKIAVKAESELLAAQSVQAALEHGQLKIDSSKGNWKTELNIDNSKVDWYKMYPEDCDLYIK